MDEVHALFEGLGGRQNQGGSSADAKVKRERSQGVVGARALGQIRAGRHPLEVARENGLELDKLRALVLAAEAEEAA